MSEEHSIGWRIALTFAIVLAVMGLLALIGYLSGGWEAQGEDAIPPSKFDQRIAELDRTAIDNAYREKIEHLFGVWLSDPTDQPRRAVNGARNARRAYIGAMKSLEEQEQRLKQRGNP